MWLYGFYLGLFKKSVLLCDFYAVLRNSEETLGYRNATPPFVAQFKHKKKIATTNSNNNNCCNNKIRTIIYTLNTSKTSSFYRARKIIQIFK